MTSKRLCPLANIGGTMCAECDEQCWVSGGWSGLPTGAKLVAEPTEAADDLRQEEFGREVSRQWRVDLHSLATFFADTQELRGVVNEVVADHLAAAGRQRCAGQLRHYYVGRGLWGTEGEAFAGIAEESMFGPGAVLLVPLRPEPGRKRPKTRAATIAWAELVRDEESR